MHTSVINMEGWGGEMKINKCLFLGSPVIHPLGQPPLSSVYPEAPSLLVQVPALPSQGLIALFWIGSSSQAPS